MWLSTSLFVCLFLCGAGKVSNPFFEMFGGGMGGGRADSEKINEDTDRFEKAEDAGGFGDSDGWFGKGTGSKVPMLYSVNEDTTDDIPVPETVESEEVVVSSSEHRDVMPIMTGTDGGNHHPNAHKKAASSGAVTININNASPHAQGGQRHSGVPHTMPGRMTRQKDCPEDFVGDNGDCFLVSTFKSERADALRYCQAFRSQLVSLERPTTNYLLKYHLHQQNVMQRTFWTSGMEKEGGDLFWECSGRKMKYKHFELPGQDISDAERQMWESQDDEEELTATPPQYDGAWMKHNVTSERDLCVILGPSDDGSEIVWHRKPCLGTKAHFVCHQGRHRAPAAHRAGHGRRSEGAADGAGMQEILDSLVEGLLEGMGDWD